MSLIETNRITILDINGCPKILQEVSVNNYYKLRELYSIYWELVIKLDPYLESDFFTLIQLDSTILSIAKSIIKICGLKPKKIGLETVAALVHSYETDEGISKGYIWQKYFETRKNANTDSEESVSIDEYKTFLIALLAESEGGIHNILPVLDVLSIDEIEQYLKHKKNIIEKVKKDPDGKVEKIKDWKKRYKEKFGNETFNGAVINQPG